MKLGMYQAITWRLLSFILCLSQVQAQWSVLNAPVNGELNGVYFSTVTNGYVVGSAGIYHSPDSGNSWTRVNQISAQGDSLIYEQTHFQDIFRINNGYWFAVGKDTINQKGVIFRKPVSTSSWELVYHAGPGINAAADAGGRVVAVGDSGIVLIAVGPGDSWNISTTNVSFDLYNMDTQGNTIYAVGAGGLLIGNSVSNDPWTIGTTQVSHDLEIINPGLVLTVNDTHIEYGSYFTWNSLHQFNGPLLSTCIDDISSNEAIIGTQEGIYKSVSGLGIWEYQPSSDNYHINDIFFVPGTQRGFAVGKNGVILETDNSGGPTHPYIEFRTANGACVDSMMYFSNQGVSTYMYSWELDGLPVSSAYNWDTSYHTPGTHTIKLIGSNGTVTDSTQESFHIVIPPDINKSFSISDTLLCQQGSSDITIHNSDTNARYSLLNLSSLQYIPEVSGNGADVVLNTSTLTDSTYFLIRTRHLDADCEKFFQDTILIEVEKTQAAFHATLYNASIGEDVHFFNNSSQADSYEWNFGQGASPQLSSAANQIVSYSQLTQPQISLIASSAFGCKDTIEAPGPFIYDPNNLPEECWALSFDGNRLDIYEHDQGESVVTDQDGNIIVSGSYSDCEFGSKIGKTSTRINDVGVYVAKYDPHGVLKWVVRSHQPVDGLIKLRNYSFVGNAFDLAIGGSGNIYVTGWSEKDAIFYSNDGDSVVLSQVGINTHGFIMKLDANGVIKWLTTATDAIPYTIEVDKYENIYLGGYSGAGFPFIGTLYSVSGIAFSSPVGMEGQDFVAKMDSNGEFQWVTALKSFGPIGLTASIEGENLSIDQDGSIYYSGTQNVDITMYSVSGPSVQVPKESIHGKDIFIGKYDTNGNAIWGHSITSHGPYPQTDDYVNDIIVDQVGNSYIVLRANSDTGNPGPGRYLVFPSTNGAIDTVSIGTYALVSYSPYGNFRWAVGVQYARIATGNAVCVDSFGYVYTTGFVGSHSAPYIGDFTSTDGNSLAIPVRFGSFFIAKYDTSGVIDWVTLESGLTSDNIASGNFTKDIVVDYFQNVIVTGDIQAYNGLPDYVIGNDTIHLNSQDAFIAKFDPNGCLNPASMSIPQLETATIKPSLKAYPNPFGSFIQVSSSIPKSSIEDFILFDLTGRVVAKWNYQISSQGSSFDTKLVPPGVYFLVGRDKFGRVLGHEQVVKVSN